MTTLREKVLSPLPAGAHRRGGQDIKCPEGEFIIWSAKSRTFGCAKSVFALPSESVALVRHFEESKRAVIPMRETTWKELLTVLGRSLDTIREVAYLDADFQT